VTFGVGEFAEIDRVAVRWPRGGEQEWRSLRAGATYELVEGERDPLLVSTMRTLSP
jgi:hypothetical protein